MWNVLVEVRSLSGGQPDPLVAHVVDGVELSKEDIAQDPGKPPGQVQAHDAADALGHSELGHLEVQNLN